MVIVKSNSKHELGKNEIHELCTDDIHSLPFQITLNGQTAVFTSKRALVSIDINGVITGIPTLPSVTACGALMLDNDYMDITSSKSRVFYLTKLNTLKYHDIKHGVVSKTVTEIDVCCFYVINDDEVITLSVDGTLDLFTYEKNKNSFTRATMIINLTSWDCISRYLYYIKDIVKFDNYIFINFMYDLNCISVVDITTKKVEMIHGDHPTDRFGECIEASNFNIFVGAPGVKRDTGAIYIIDPILNTKKPLNIQVGLEGSKIGEHFQVGCLDTIMIYDVILDNFRVLNTRTTYLQQPVFNKAVLSKNGDVIYTDVGIYVISPHGLKEYICASLRHLIPITTPHDRVITRHSSKPNVVLVW